MDISREQLVQHFSAEPEKSKLEKWYRKQRKRPGTFDEQIDYFIKAFEAAKKGKDLPPEPSQPGLSNPTAHEPDDVTDDAVMEPGHSLADKIMAWTEAAEQHTLSDLIDVVETVTVWDLKNAKQHLPEKFLRDIEDYASNKDVVGLARQLRLRSGMLGLPQVIRALREGGVPASALSRLDDHVLAVNFPNGYTFHIDAKGKTVALGVNSKEDGFIRTKSFKLTDKFVHDLIAAYHRRT